MLSSRYLEYAQAADDIGAEIVGIFERDELGCKHAVTMLLWHDSAPHWSISDASVGGPLTDNNGFAAITASERIECGNDAQRNFANHVKHRFAPCPFDHPASH